MAEHVIINPRRKRRRRRTTTTTRRRRNPVAAVNRRRRRRPGAVTYHYRNPRRRSARMLSLRGIGVKDVGYATAGMLGTNTLAPQAARMVGVSELGVTGYLTKAATAMLLSFVVAKFISKKGAQSCLFGGLITLANDVWQTEVKPRIGLSGLGVYRPAGPRFRRLPMMPTPTAVTSVQSRVPERLVAAY